ncbi:MAG: 2-phospho-L-lactate transferase CofD family protein, partial [Patescibacteria group bacterium]
MKNIVIIGGGTGTFTLLEGLRRYPSNNSVIASTADDGGSGGQLRYELAIIPPGDYRQCLIGLAYTDEVYKKLFAYR